MECPICKTTMIPIKNNLCSCGAITEYPTNTYVCPKCEYKENINEKQLNQK